MSHSKHDHHPHTNPYPAPEHEHDHHYKEHSEHTERTLLWHILKTLERILEVDTSILARLPSPSLVPVRGIFTQGQRPQPGQGQGESHMVTGTIKGLLPGGSDTFFVTPVDVNGNADALPSGSPVPTIVADDATVTVTTAADGMSAQVAAAASASPGSSFNLLWTANFTKQDGTQATITATANVPILTPPPPPTLDPVGGVFSQGSPAAAPVTAASRLAPRR